MSKKKDGGFVHPSKEITVVGEGGGSYRTAHEVQGITRRDYLAALAMQGMMANTETKRVAIKSGKVGPVSWDDLIASQAYRLADALIKEGEK